jgi:hypothetical protein
MLKNIPRLLVPGAQTGESRKYGNVILRKGVIAQDA